MIRLCEVAASGLFHTGEPVAMCLTSTTTFRLGVTFLCYQLRGAKRPQRRRG